MLRQTLEENPGQACPGLWGIATVMDVLFSRKRRRSGRGEEGDQIDDLLIRQLELAAGMGCRSAKMVVRISGTDADEARRT